jgi:hypothetical protein
MPHYPPVEVTTFLSRGHQTPTGGP